MFCPKCGTELKGNVCPKCVPSKPNTIDQAKLEKQWNFAIKGIIVVIVLFVGMIAIAAFAPDNEPKTTEKAKDKAAVSDTSNTKSIPAAASSTNQSTANVEDESQEEDNYVYNSPEMTKEEFDQLKSGMTYKECCMIIGGDGELVSEVGSPEDDYYTVVYTFEGDGGIGANANLTFQGGALQIKAQFGLE